ncbi:MAG: sulfatase-like hydrolase/transferase, partial [Pirellulales bacterium]
SYYPDFIWLNEERFDLPGNTNGRRQQYSHDFFTGFALNFIRRHQDQPFFLYLPYTIPHSDYEAPDLGPYSDRDWPKGAREYAAMVTRMDGDVGRIMALLNELGIDEQTIVFFCSDHGGNNPFQSVFNSNGPLRERKGSLYEGGLRIPMIVRWPGHVAAGSVSEAVWYFTDFMPTAIELSGGKDSVHLKTDGVSIVPTLLGKDQDFADRFLYWERFGGGFQQAARWRNWKAVRNGLNGPLELYDLAKDASEARDVSTQNPEVVRQIEDYLRTARVDSEEWPVVRSKKNARKAQVTASNKK